jgi:hypothetical protein
MSKEKNLHKFPKKFNILGPVTTTIRVPERLKNKLVLFIEALEERANYENNMDKDGFHKIDEILTKFTIAVRR